MNKLNLSTFIYKELTHLRGIYFTMSFLSFIKTWSTNT
jgi:hypothetical protein